MRGYHIVLEGPDAAGKKTQSELLVSWLNETLIVPPGRAIRMSFPQYGRPFGRLVRQYLDGNSPSQDPYYAALLYAADRAESTREIAEELGRGNWVVCDRYVESNIAHQSARMDSAVEQERLALWVRETEYGLLGILPADLTILLNVPYELCHKKAQERRKAHEQDIHEDDENHLRKAWEQYQMMADTGQWPVITCTDKKGELLSREAIAVEIQDVIRTRLNV